METMTSLYVHRSKSLKSEPALSAPLILEQNGDISENEELEFLRGRPKSHVQHWGSVTSSRHNSSEGMVTNEGNVNDERPVSLIFSLMTDKTWGTEPGQKNTIQWLEITIVLKFVKVYFTKSKVAWCVFIYSFIHLARQSELWPTMICWVSYVGCRYQGMVFSSGKTTSGGAGPESKQMMTTVLTECLGRGQLRELLGNSRGSLSPD